MKHFGKAYLIILLAAVGAFAFVDGLELPTPDANAQVSIGFNYDYLKSPLDVDFENAKGFYSLNIPIRFALSEEMIDAIFSDISENFSDDEYFMPNLAARQYANTTIKVDVPMLWGVCSFSHTNIMALRYNNQTGIPNFTFRQKFGEGDDDFDGDLLLRGNLNTPINFSLGWEAMTFSYAYKLNELFTFALSLHRHKFHFNMKGNIDADIRGVVDADASGAPIRIDDINYSLKNPISGEYTLERWTPTFAARIWRFDLLARIMFKDEAKGALAARYTLPFFVNPSNFTLDPGLENADGKYIMDNITNGNFLENRTNTIDLNTNKNMKWQMPHVFTLKYNIIPEHLAVSYSKMVGQTRLELVDKELQHEMFPDGYLDLRVGVDIDHLILLNAKFGWFFGNIGIMSFNADYNDQKGLMNDLNAAFLLKYGRGVALPTLSGGGIIGTKLQLMLELNVLPLTALKTGLVYNF